ncbi:hypothetical protein ACFX15_005496 [Malus domestica]
MWFVYDGKAADDSVPYTRVAVFRVSISNDSGGNSILSASLEAAEFCCSGSMFAVMIEGSSGRYVRPNHRGCGLLRFSQNF